VVNETIINENPGDNDAGPDLASYDDTDSDGDWSDDGSDDSGDSYA